MLRLRGEETTQGCSQLGYPLLQGCFYEPQDGAQGPFCESQHLNCVESICSDMSFILKTGVSPNVEPCLYSKVACITPGAGANHMHA